MHTYNTVVTFFQEGGLFMIPTAIVMALGIAVAIERWWSLRRAEIRNRKEWDKLGPIVTGGDVERAREATAKSKAEIGTILNYGLARLHGSHKREDVEMAMEESLLETVPNLQRRTHYMAVFANVALLLGLLGTVIGLIDAFGVVATKDLSNKTTFLFNAISVTMNNTAFGLMVSIPFLLIHAMLTTKTSRIVDSLEMATVKFLNTVPFMADRSAD
ncbi:MAG: MotA/TolQ/ExbB proton channel family protein [Salinisphaera sp.]|nr:MotA/TolQ/ExbB proton channel family protein [Salinisphaera sp.]MDN5937381.1 MotA/TolQ/ExbB proton channel family protein [Salinisphaera sp.]